MKIIILAIVVLMTAHVGIAAPVAEVGENPSRFLSWKDGLASQSQLLNPGKVDFHFRGASTDQQWETFLWTPMFKGGVGWIDPQLRESTTYWGGYFRPWAGMKDHGDLIVAAQSVDANNRRDFE